MYERDRHADTHTDGRSPHDGIASRGKIQHLYEVNFKGRTSSMNAGCRYGRNNLQLAIPISRSIVQGSGLGPMLFVVYALNLKPISEHNRIIKYADDTTLLVADKSSVDVAT